MRQQRKIQHRCQDFILFSIDEGYFVWADENVNVVAFISKQVAWHQDWQCGWLWIKI